MRLTAKILAPTVVVMLLGPASGFAQQNLFNVSVPETAKPHEIFLQQQVNILLSGTLGTSSTTIDYGLTSDFELGWRNSLRARMP